MSAPEFEAHNKLPLLTLRARYLPSTPLGNETHAVTLETSSSLSDAAFTRCFELVRDNMQDMYKRSTMGWSSVKKKKEMRHPAIRYLLLRTKGGAISNENHDEEQQQEPEEYNELAEGGNQNSWEDEGDLSKIVGFLSFMITEEEEEHVIYIYELQLAQSSQNQGLGKSLLNVAEGYGRAVGMPKAMLTCFSENVGAMRFYHRNGYEVDKISPLAKMTRSGEMREPSYCILGKSLLEEKDEVERST